MPDRISAVYFDLETSHPDPEWDINTWDRIERLPITCAAAFVVLTDSRGKEALADKIFWAGMHLAPNKLIIETIKEIADGEITPLIAMTDDEVENMLDFLIKAVNGDTPTPYPLKSKPRLFTWNGTGFDFPAIASNIPHRLDDVVKLAKASYDPCFQWVRQFGWPIGIPATAEAMLGREKAEGMTSADAVTLWADDPARVLRYVMGDVDLLSEIVEAIRAEKQIRWINRKGKQSAKTVKGFLNVAKTMGLKEPDRSWMGEDAWRFELDHAVAWMESEIDE
jgi:hypothetical protein